MTGVSHLTAKAAKKSDPVVMSAMGHGRTLDRACGMSAYALRTDMLSARVDVG